MKKTLSVFALVACSYTYMAANALAEDDRLLSLNDPMAPFLETRAYAEKIGATAEFRKMEGVAYDEKNNKLYIECRPGNTARIYMKKNGDSWQVLDGENVNYDGVYGSWNNCNASVTPWNTGLTSEEYEPLATKAGWWENVADMTDYLGIQANPYDYGYPVELIPDPEGESVTTRVVKHYAMGRLSYEMSRVMKDQKTVYSGDDGIGVILAKFVAAKQGDLSAGTIYAAKVSQQPDQSLVLEWLEIGRGNSGDVYDAIRNVALK